ncbi:hypothetical protein O1611_g9976 [Lasiodiplodia mahajangana]|uniref:Uncharacterized protein n=1 Tax=Lasiodiplodia mahajangana TaxID=1108764 RepID=A0ACC2J3A1_9PEZI|nr:hypothetical protein O1611_g9976 [Lasiodiplodia mahajangana]
MNEALCSMLTGEEDWHFDSEGKSIRFNKDGTGELECRCNLNFWILAEFEWKSIEPQDNGSSGASAGLGHTTAIKHDSSQPERLGQLDLEITLTRRLAGRARRWAEAHPSTAEQMNKNLTGDAYQPKSYNVRIERGNFIQPCYAGYQNSDMERYSLRLLFDKSPYPPRSEWRDPQGAPDEGKFWDLVEFVGRAAPDSAKRQRPMNDPSASSWNSCVIS